MKIDMAQRRNVLAWEPVDIVVHSSIVPFFVCACVCVCRHTVPVGYVFVLVGRRRRFVCMATDQF